MSADIHDLAWLDARATIVESELARMCRLSIADVEELVEYGLLVPVDGTPSAYVFSAACVQPLRQAGALRARFDLEPFVLGLLFSQFERIARLEQELRTLRAHLPHAAPPRDGPAPWHEPHG
jgi:chaperone modulatory protein CbpM